MAHSTITCCKNCQDRTAEPVNCHSVCEKYLTEKAKWDSIREEAQKQNDTRHAVWKVKYGKRFEHES